jgi:ABC-type uncharacterized transport system involved in gliding motility auxiliary subunit
VALSRPISAGETETGEESQTENEATEDSGIEEGNGDPANPTPENPDDADLEAKESRLVVIGNAAFATDGLFEQQLNGDVFLNSVSWLGQADDTTLSIRPREVTNRRITMTVQQQIGLGVFALLVLPVVGLIAAVLLWLKRR